MNDRGLLEAAAKSARNGAVWYAGLGMGIDSGGPFPKLWNPLDDDGDALRLAVKLGLDVSHNTFANVIVDHYTRPEDDKIVLPHGADPCAATRRAIVRAAAAMAAD